MQAEKEITEKVRKTDVLHEVKVPFNATQIAIEVYENLPEASMSMDCIGYKYARKDLDSTPNPKRFKFIFRDFEEEDENGNPKEHIVTIKEAEKGVAKLLDLIVAGKLHFYGCETVSDLMDLGNWDAEVVDAAVQCAIFGEVIYG